MADSIAAWISAVTGVGAFIVAVIALRRANLAVSTVKNFTSIGYGVTFEGGQGGQGGYGGGGGGGGAGGGGMGGAGGAYYGGPQN